MGGNQRQIKKEFGDEVVPQNKKTKFVGTKADILKEYETKNGSIEEVRLSEKEYKNRMNDLLETDPMLKKSQAHFYVGYCYAA